MSTRIDTLLDMGRLVREPAPDEEVSGLWAHAVEAYEDACLEKRSPNRRLTSPYDAGRVAALAVVRATDLRVRASNHHEVTVTAAGFLAGGELEALLQEFQALRLERIQIEYGWKTRTSAAEVERALPRIRDILVHASRAIARRRPSVRDDISPPATPDTENG